MADVGQGLLEAIPCLFCENSVCSDSVLQAKKKISLMETLGIGSLKCSSRVQ